ncbi:hypothetical protein ACM8BQ_33590, partial [Pseudomonas aeruginosa]
DAQDAMSDVSLSAQGFLSMASHNIYYVKLNVSFIKTSVFRLRLREFETIWLGSRFLARLW